MGAQISRAFPPRWKVVESDCDADWIRIDVLGICPPLGAACVAVTVQSSHAFVRYTVKNTTNDRSTRTLQEYIHTLQICARCNASTNYGKNCINLCRQHSSVCYGQYRRAVDKNPVKVFTQISDQM